MNFARQHELLDGLGGLARLGGLGVARGLGIDRLVWKMMGNWVITMVNDG
jgi:hypothetical protein